MDSYLNKLDMQKMTSYARLLSIQLILLGCLGACAQQCKPSRLSHYGYALKSFAYSTFRANDRYLDVCSTKCVEDQECKSTNYNLVSHNCEHNTATKEGFPSFFVREENSVYADVRDPKYGTTRGLSVHSCKRIQELTPDAPNGVYWIKPGNDVNPFQVYCEMTIDGGGWTLVYSYRFTNFADFIADSNAVTPFPTWPISDWHSSTWTPRSNVAPLNETALSAMDFPLWRKIGEEFLVKPNITHWIACLKGTGDVLNWKAGTLNCRLIKNVAQVCLDYVPTTFLINIHCGVALYRNGDFSFYFEGNLQRCYPVHDPCGRRSIHNHLKNIPNPGGVLYVR